MRLELLPGDMRDALLGVDTASIASCVTDPPYHLTSIVRRFGSDSAVPARSAGPTGVYARSSAGFMGQKWDGGDIAFKPDTWRAVFDVLKPGAHLAAFGGTRTFHRMAVAIEDAGFEIRDSLFWIYGTGFPKSHDVAQQIEKLHTIGAARRPDRDLGGLPRDRFSGSTEGTLIADTGGKVPLTTPEAAAWEGWGTALKPAVEPIILARKPLVGTVARNVLAHGCGALHIDACRVPHTGAGGSWGAGKRPGGFGNVGADKGGPEPCGQWSELGRWPANVLHDGSEEIEAAFAAYAVSEKDTPSRFFYCAKASAVDRAGSKHPTVKPVALMRWLCRLVTPPGGTILDPFAGSGTTLAAAHAEGFDAIGIEREPAFQADIMRRLQALELAELIG